MAKFIFLLFLLLGIGAGCQIADAFYLPTEIVPIVVQMDYNNGTGAITGCKLNYSVYYANKTYIKKLTSTEIAAGVYQNISWRANVSADYFVIANCTKGGKRYLSGLSFNIGGKDNMIPALLALSPLLLAIICIIWAVALDKEEHGWLKAFLSLLTFVLFWATLYLGQITLVKFYNFPELQDAVSTMVWVTGILLFGLIFYWIVIGVRDAVKSAEGKKMEKLKY